MSDLRDLYQEVILDHGRKPRNRGTLPAPARHADGHNPVCGDRITVYIALDGDTVRDVRFEGQGCAISIASASMMAEALIGRSLDEVRSLFGTFHELVTADEPPPDLDERLGKLMVFSGVREYPVRVKCATLAWHTLQAAIEAQDAPVSTEST